MSVNGTGPTPCNLLICGERPGFEEARAGKPFVGPAGQELWRRIWKTMRLTREDFYVTNLVRTFSKEPPSRGEVEEDAPYLRAELQRVRPKIILTIGYHAARWFLPQFEGVKGDFFHGKCFLRRFKDLTVNVVPIVHSSAALRQPEKYQAQLTDDLRSAKRVIDGEQGVHETRTPQPYRVGLANFGKAGQTLGLDTEGSIRELECVTLTAGRREVACVETHQGKPSPFLAASIGHASALVIHHAKHDMQALHGIGVDPLPRVDDTMLMAYLLGLPQSLKVLAYRELGYVMREYADIVDPLDEAVVRTTLQAQLTQWESGYAALQHRAVKVATARAQGKRVTKKAIKASYERLLANSDLPAHRVASGLRRMLTVKEESGVDDE